MSFFGDLFKACLGGDCTSTSECSLPSQVDLFKLLISPTLNPDLQNFVQRHKTDEMKECLLTPVAAYVDRYHTSDGILEIACAWVETQRSYACPLHGDTDSYNYGDANVKPPLIIYAFLQLSRINTDALQRIYWLTKQPKLCAQEKSFLWPMLRATIQKMDPEGNLPPIAQQAIEMEASEIFTCLVWSDVLSSEITLQNIYVELLDRLQEIYKPTVFEYYLTKKLPRHQYKGESSRSILELLFKYAPLSIIKLTFQRIKSLDRISLANFLPLCIPTNRADVLCFISEWFYSLEPTDRQREIFLSHNYPDPRPRLHQAISCEAINMIVPLVTVSGVPLDSTYNGQTALHYFLSEYYGNLEILTKLETAYKARDMHQTFLGKLRERIFIDNSCLLDITIECNAIKTTRFLVARGAMKAFGDTPAERITYCLNKEYFDFISIALQQECIDGSVEAVEAALKQTASLEGFADTTLLNYLLHYIIKGQIGWDEFLVTLLPTVMTPSHWLEDMRLAPLLQHDDNNGSNTPLNPMFPSEDKAVSFSSIESEKNLKSMWSDSITSTDALEVKNSPSNSSQSNSASTQSNTMTGSSHSIPVHTSSSSKRTSSSSRFGSDDYNPIALCCIEKYSFQRWSLSSDGCRAALLEKCLDTCGEEVFNHPSPVWYGGTKTRSIFSSICKRIMEHHERHSSHRTQVQDYYKKLTQIFELGLDAGHKPNKKFLLTISCKDPALAHSIAQRYQPIDRTIVRMLNKLSGTNRYRQPDTPRLDSQKQQLGKYFRTIKRICL